MNQRVMCKIFISILVAILGISVGSSQTFTDGEWSYTLNERKEATVTSYSGTDQVLTIPSSVDEYPVKSFGGGEGPAVGNTMWPLLSVTIPDGVTSIGDYAFRNCGKLASVIIPDSVTSIGGYAFADCFRLANLTIPDSVTSIGEGAFYFCRDLTSVTIPNSVTSIGDGAFWGCIALTRVQMPARFSNEVGRLNLDPKVVTFTE